MTKTNKGSFLKKRLVFWLVVCVCACIFFTLINFAYNECTTTYTSTASLSDYHQANISFMKSNRDSSMNTILYNYEIENGKYIIGFAFFYNLACLLVIAVVAFSCLNVYYSLGLLVKYHNDKHARKAAKHTRAMYNLEKEMRAHRYI